jgi:hypothetical protein
MRRAAKMEYVNVQQNLGAAGLCDSTRPRHSFIDTLALTLRRYSQ